MSSIVIAEYDPAWSQLYAEEQQKIRALIGTYIFDIQHIGSTSVPGLAAKPVIDIMIGIHSLDLVEQTVEPLASLGYEHLGEHGIPERHFFRKPAHAISFAERTHHLHMMERGHIQWETHQLFRDYLRTHPEALAAYEQLKRDLALQFSDDRFAYTDAKADFITATIEKARAEKTDPGRVSATDL